MSEPRDEVRFELCGPERAGDVHRITQAAFAPQRDLRPPSGAVSETLEIVARDLEAGGGAVAIVGEDVVACLRWLVADGRFHARRVAVDPAYQHRGHGRALMNWIENEAARRGFDAIEVGVRLALPGNLAMYQSLGYAVAAEHRHEGYDHTTWLTLEKQLTRTLVGEAEAAG